LAEVHQIGGNLLLIVAGLHAAAALWHHFVKRQDTLQRMMYLPASGRRDSGPTHGG
jgi:cytochrome b561